MKSCVSVYCWHAHGHLKDQSPRPTGIWRSFLSAGWGSERRYSLPLVQVDTLRVCASLSVWEQLTNVGKSWQLQLPPTSCYSLRLPTSRHLLLRLAEVWGFVKKVHFITANPAHHESVCLFLHSLTAPVRFLGPSHRVLSDVVLCKPLSILWLNFLAFSCLVLGSQSWITRLKKLLIFLFWSSNTSTRHRK